MIASKKNLILVADDLFFSSKIESAAKSLGAELVKVKNREELRGRIERTPPDLVIMDLASKTIDMERAFAEIRRLAGGEGVFCVGYLPHVERELADRFREKGVDLVIARSRFSREMREILGERLKTR